MQSWTWGINLFYSVLFVKTMHDTLRKIVFMPTLSKTNFKFSIEYSIGFLLIVFYRIFADSFL